MARLVKIGAGDKRRLVNLLVPYYREGEDEETPIDEIEAFCGVLFSLITDGKASGCIAYTGDTACGFVLYTTDAYACDFGELPGYGTILEIGVVSEYRKNGIGGELVAEAEKNILGNGIVDAYVCAYGKAQDFWKNRGYTPSDKTAANGLPIFVKKLK